MVYPDDRHGDADVAGRIESIAFTNLSGSLTPPITNQDYLGITMNVQVTNQLDAKQYKTTPDAKFTGSSNPIVIQTAIDLRNTT